VTRRVPVDAGLALRRLDAGHGLRPLLGAADLKAGVEGGRAAPAGAAWSASYFGLDRAAAFRGLAPRRRDEALRRLAAGLLAESAHIEKVGLAFAAKMILLSRSEEERRLYALFAADESRHLAEVSRYLPHGWDGAPVSPFLLLLGEVIEEGGKPGLTRLIQVVLEGWGLTHYGSLARSCRDEALRRTLRRVLKDEALHHGTGVVLSKQERLPPSERRAVRGWLLRLCALVQAGPQAVVDALGPLSRRRREEAFADLSCETHAAERLALLRGLIASCGESALVDELEDHGAFRPLSAAACAKI
jgi:hypothetical protein